MNLLAIGECHNKHLTTTLDFFLLIHVMMVYSVLIMIHEMHCFFHFHALVFVTAFSYLQAKCPKKGVRDRENQRFCD